MNPTVATLVTLFGIALLWRHDATHGEAGSGARWLPVLWMGITGSRFLSQWLSLGEAPQWNYTEGSPLDALYFASLILLAGIVLMRRGVRVGDVARANGVLVALALLFLVSVLWSDDPAIAIKRWIKTLGHPLMALVILTDRDPVGSLRAVLKRVSYALLPLSVLFIKYLPQYGRGFDFWTGQGLNVGVALNKNDLAMMCMVAGVFFFWNLLTVDRLTDRRERWREVGISVAFIVMALWLLDMSDGATSTATLAVAVATMIVLGWRIVSKRRFVVVVVAALVVITLLESWFGIYEQVILMLGRNPTLTDRTVVWAEVLALQNRPIFGYGFESFWLGSRLDEMWARWWWHPIQAHNGYIEMYLNQGIVGIALLALLLVSTFLRIARQLLTDFQFARLRLAFLLAVILFNYTEAAFKGVAMMWTIFHIIAMEPPRPRAKVLTAPPVA